MITRTIKTTGIEYTVFNRETDEVQTIVRNLIGTFADEEAIIKALKNRLFDHEIVLKAKVISVTTEKYGMSLDQFVETAVKLDD